VCRHFLGYFCGGLAGCAALLLLVEIFDCIDRFIGRQVLWVDAVRYLAFKLPWMVYQMMPAACLLASVLTFSTLNKHQETTAMRAHGISPLRLTRPLLLLGCVVSLVLLVAQEYLLPYTNQSYNLSGGPIQRVKTGHVWGYLKGQIWYRSAQRIWSANSAPLERRLLGVTIYERTRRHSRALMRQKPKTARAGRCSRARAALLRRMACSRASQKLLQSNVWRFPNALRRSVRCARSPRK
jgi:lipopolysaccharide export LptBFGC system permease protein LptF